MRNLWIVGRHTGATWDFQGVFNSQELAESACRDASYFVGPAVENENLPEPTDEDGWPGAYYPKAAA